MKPESSLDRLLTTLALCINRTSACTTSDMGGRNSGSGYTTENNNDKNYYSCEGKDWRHCSSNWILVFTCPITCVHVCARSISFNFNIERDFTWTQRAMMSAKRDKDFAAYMPLSEGSTIFARASISWSWGVAHLTKDCSDLTLELELTGKRKQGFDGNSKWL